MGIYLNTDAAITVNAVDLSDHAFGLSIGGEKEQVEVTTFNSTATRTYLPGNRDDTITVRFLQDFAAAKVDATLWPLFNASTSFVVVVKPTSASPSATNPSFTATCSLFSYSPIDGNVGERSETEAVFKVTTGAIVRATS